MNCLNLPIFPWKTFMLAHFKVNLSLSGFHIGSAVDLEYQTDWMDARVIPTLIIDVITNLLLIELLLPSPSDHYCLHLFASCLKCHRAEYWSYYHTLVRRSGKIRRGLVCKRMTENKNLKVWKVCFYEEFEKVQQIIFYASYIDLLYNIFTD